MVDRRRHSAWMSASHEGASIASSMRMTGQQITSNPKLHSYFSPSEGRRDTYHFHKKVNLKDFNSTRDRYMSLKR